MSIKHREKLVNIYSLQVTSSEYITTLMKKMLVSLKSTRNKNYY